MRSVSWSRAVHQEPQAMFDTVIVLSNDAELSVLPHVLIGHNPYLKVFVANGHYDLATPYLATRYTFDHMGLPPELRSNVNMGYYEAGHMMYVNEPSRVALKKDLAAFLHSALPPK